MKHMLASCFMLAGILSSCKKVIDVKLPEGETRVVLNVLLQEDSLIDARITFLSNATTSIISEPETATLSLYENNVFKEELTPITKNGRKYYRSTSMATAENVYKVTATLAQHPVIEGADKIPTAGQITSQALTHTVDSRNRNYTRLKTVIKDNPQERNYYMFRLFSTNPFLDTATSFEKRWFTANQTVVDGINLFEELDYDVLFVEDRLFNGKEMEFLFNLYGHSDSVLIEVSSLTENSFKYFKSVDKAQHDADNYLPEPVAVFSNVKNGLGIVGGISVKRIVVYK